jgi:hypothetical protein
MPGRHQIQPSKWLSASSTAAFIIRLAPPPSPETHTGDARLFATAHRALKVRVARLLNL